jgi:hypothetical protein
MFWQLYICVYELRIYRFRDYFLRLVLNTIYIVFYGLNFSIKVSLLVLFLMNFLMILTICNPFPPEVGRTPIHLTRVHGTQHHADK